MMQGYYKWPQYTEEVLRHGILSTGDLGYFDADGRLHITGRKKDILVMGDGTKIFLPEFSRLYKAGDQPKIRHVYGSIMRIQMLIVGPMAVLLLGFPRVILRVLASELVSYDQLFVGCSMIFLLVATLGPNGGILQMTGNEKMVNRIRACALGVMLVVMLLTAADPYFVLYGMCVEVAVEAAAKYFYICRWMKKAPASLRSYLSWWIVPALAVILAHVLKVGDSFLMMVLFAGTVFAISGWRELRENQVFKRK